MTREEAIEILNRDDDRIREELEKQEKWLMGAGYTAYNVDIALDAIKSAVAESEIK